MLDGKESFMKKEILFLMMILAMPFATAAGSVSFSSPTASSTTATFSSSGTYTITLAVSDGVTTSSKTFTIVALPNVPPVLGPCNANGIGGSGTSLGVSFSSGTLAVAGVQFSLGLPTGASLTSIAAGTASTAAGKSVSFSSSTANANVLVFGFNSNAIGSGTLVNFGVQLAANVPGGALTLPVTNAVFSDPNGVVVAGTANNCSIQVTANAPPSIINITAPASVVLPNTATFSATVTDVDPTRPLSYQWSGQ
jgi:hypothetical protein